MTEATNNAIGESIINLELTVNQVNLLLNVLGNAPYVQSANLIAQVQAQGVPQLKKLEETFEAIKAAEPKIEEAKA